MKSLHRTILATLAALALVNAPAFAQKKYGPGVTDTEIKLGQTAPYSGPMSLYGNRARVQLAYYKMLNDKGGINGRKITLLSLDDAYSPPKTVEQTRKLVESDGVLAITGSNGTAGNLAIYKYLNGKKVPQIVIGSGVLRWENGSEAPWTTPFQLGFATEGKIFAKYLLENKPNAKVGALYQNDDVGKEFMQGLREVLGAKAATMIVKEETYNVTDTTVDSQVVSLQGSGADTFMLVAIGKFPAQAIRKAYDSGWKPHTLTWSTGNSIKTVLEPAGLDRSNGLVTTTWLKVPGTQSWTPEDKGVAEYLAFMKKYAPNIDPNDQDPVMGYTVAQMTAHILERCGDDLTRENVIRQATSITNFTPPLILPGLALNNTAKSRNPVRVVQMARFDGKNWVPFGRVVGAD